MQVCMAKLKKSDLEICLAAALKLFAGLLIKNKAFDTNAKMPGLN